MKWYSACSTWNGRKARTQWRKSVTMVTGYSWALRPLAALCEDTVLVVCQRKTHKGKPCGKGDIFGSCHIWNLGCFFPVSPVDGQNEHLPPHPLLCPTTVNYVIKRFRYFNFFTLFCISAAVPSASDQRTEIDGFTGEFQPLPGMCLTWRCLLLTNLSNRT